MKDKFIKDTERLLFALMQRNVYFLQTEEKQRRKRRTQPTSIIISLSKRDTVGRFKTINLQTFN